MDPRELLHNIFAGSQDWTIYYTIFDSLLLHKLTENINQRFVIYLVKWSIYINIIVNKKHNYIYYYYYFLNFVTFFSDPSRNFTWCLSVLQMSSWGFYSIETRNMCFSLYLSFFLPNFSDFFFKLFSATLAVVPIEVNALLENLSFLFPLSFVKQNLFIYSFL